MKNHVHTLLIILEFYLDNVNAKACVLPTIAQYGNISLYVGCDNMNCDI